MLSAAHTTVLPLLQQSPNNKFLKLQIVSIRAHIIACLHIYRKVSAIQSHVQFRHFTGEPKNTITTYVVHMTFLVNDDSCSHTPFSFFNFVKAILFLTVFLRKKCIKICIFRFAKQQKWHLKLHLKFQERRMWYIRLSWQARKIHVHNALTKFCFLNFTNIIDFLSINFS